MLPADHSNSLRIVASTLTLLVAGCPQDVALPEDNSSTGASTSTTGDGVLTGPMTGTSPTSTSDPTTSGGPTTDGPTGDPTGGNETANLGDTTTASSSSSSSTTGEDGSSSSTTGDDTSGTSTSDASTTGGSGDTGTSSSGETSTGSSSGDDTSSGDDPSTSSSSGDDTSSGDSSSGGDDTGEQPPIEQALPMCCEAGCSGTLFQSIASVVDVAHNGTRIVTQNHAETLLWDADSLALIARLPASGLSRLRGDRLVYPLGAELHVVDAVDGSQLGVCATAAQWGLALDGSYLWTADAAGLQILEPDCSVRWKLAGLLADAKVHALADAVHVFDKDLDPAAIVHGQAVTGVTLKTPFVGNFPQFFADSAMYWTNKSGVYRVFAADGAELVTGEGFALWGWGPYLRVGADVININNPAVKLAAVDQFAKFVGPAIVGRPFADNKVKVIHLDTVPLEVETLTLPCCAVKDHEISFAIAGDKWVLGAEQGMSLDHLGRRVTVGDVTALAGAPSGRLTFGVHAARTYVYDITDDCEATVHPWFPALPSGLWIAGGGGLLITREKYSAFGLQTPRSGSRFYGLPSGELLAGNQPGLTMDVVFDHDVADDGLLWSRTWTTPALPTKAHSESLPFGEVYTGGISDVLPKIAPDGQHIVISDGVSGMFDDWVGDHSHVRVPDPELNEPVASFDGISHGFIDDTHILVSHYVDPDDTFAGSEIVDITGLVVQQSDLPDIRRLYRIGTGEILAYSAVSNRWSIFDPWTGAELWASGLSSGVTAVGEDFVAIHRSGRVELVRWR